MPASSAHASVSAGSLRTAWLTAWILMFVNIMLFIERGVLTILVVPIQQEMGLSDVQLGLLQGFAFSIFYGAAAIPMGWMADRLPRRMIIFGGLLGCSAAVLISGLARSFTGLFAGRAVLGAGAASIAPAAFSMIADSFPRDRLAAGIGLYYLGPGVGVALALGLGGLILQGLTDAGGLHLPVLGHISPWQATFMIVGIPGLLLSFVILLIREPQRRSAPSEGGDWKEFFQFLALRRRVILHHFLGFPLLALCVFAVEAWTAIYMSRTFHWNIAAIGMSLGVSIGLLGAFANVAAGRVADAVYRSGRRDAHFRVHVFAALLALPILICGYLTTNVWLFIGLLTVGKALLTCFGGTAMASLQIVAPPRVRARLAGLYLLVLTLVGNGLGPLVTALVTEHVFADRSKVGLSVITVLIVAGGIAILNLFLGMKPLREAIAQVDRDRPEVA